MIGKDVCCWRSDATFARGGPLMDPLSTMQVRALEFVESWRDELIDLARRLVVTPSPSPPGDERAVACVTA